MKFRINEDSKVNRVGQCPFAYVSGKDANLQSIYDQIWFSGYGGIGYKFAVVIDVSQDEYSEPSKEGEIYYLDDIVEEVLEYVGTDYVKKWLREKGCDVK